MDIFNCSRDYPVIGWLHSHVFAHLEKCVRRTMQDVYHENADNYRRTCDILHFEAFANLRLFFTRIKLAHFYLLGRADYEIRNERQSKHSANMDSLETMIAQCLC